MGRSWCILVGIAASACTIKDVDYAGKSCPCAAGYTCDTATNTCHVGDASIGTDTPPGETCYGTGPTTVCLRGAPAVDLLQPPGNITIDTDASSMCVAVDGTNIANACVVVANTVHVANGIAIYARGSRPLIMLGVTLIDIGGTFDVAAHRGVTGAPQPPGSNPQAACSIVTLAGAGGGAGGSFGGMGGHGGTATNGVVGQTAQSANPSIMPVRGGCTGGTGGNASSAGIGGVGGGAVYFISGTSIIVMGTIDASGEGGAGAATLAGGGGGGGAGGLVAFDAPSISVTGNVFANGGGGGGGSTDTVAGGNGGDPAPPGTVAADGGTGALTGERKGGVGSVGTTKAGTGGANSSNTGGGGGGGGGAGVIRVFPAQQLVGKVSPPAS